MTEESGAGNEAHLIGLAGLLHDVGKLGQRAGWRSGTHTDVGGEFVSTYVPERWRAYLYPVMGHHDRPLEGRTTKIVALADRLSAAEREEAAATGDRQLVSILCRVGDVAQRPRARVWPLRPLTLEAQTLLPREPLSDDEETAAYEALWGGFTEAVEGLPSDDLATYLAGLYDALRRYTWCVPGAYYRAVPDVSLFDHSRATAALAACLTGLDEGRLDALLAGEGRDEDLVLLVGGDVSGVQDFIYTITARGAAKGLRGRSFYLEMLTEAIARYLLRRLGLPMPNLIYAGGGHFYFLAPLSEEDLLEATRAEVSGKLLAYHGGDLYVALGWTRASARDFDRERFSERWHTVSQAMNRAKRQRFSELEGPELLMGRVFGPLGAGGGEDGECQVCHFDGAVHTEREGAEDERRICALCLSLEALGTDLRDAGYLLVGDVEPEETERKGYRAALRAFGSAVGLLAEDGSTILGLPDEVERATLYAIRDLPGVSATARRISAEIHCPVAPGTRYTVNVTPRKGKGVATFEDLQDASRGVRRLGVLRMDVDDLGDLFRWGMRDEGTLSRVASLSFALSLFFEGWVGERCREINAEGPGRIYAIYSGGDDLFIVGAWDVLPELADTLRRDLARFAAGNPMIHMSGGLTLHGGKYPLYQAARDAGRALDWAKDLERPEEPGHRKDAFGFLGGAFPWESFGVVMEEKEQLVRAVTSREEGGLGIDRALLRRLLNLYRRFCEAVGERGKPVWGPWVWQSAYHLRRMEERYRRDEEAAATIKGIRETLGRNGFRYIETLGPAARWAELLTRKEQER